MKRICRIIFDDPERDTRVVAYVDRYAADRHGEMFLLNIGGGAAIPLPVCAPCRPAAGPVF